MPDVKYLPKQLAAARTLRKDAEVQAGLAA
jgi:hypothetical protein